MGLIYGDGINWDEKDPSLPKIHKTLMNAGWSVENIVLGMGGGLMSKHNRDTHKMAFKMNAAVLNDGTVQEIFKDPVTDPGKTSLKGVLDVVEKDGKFEVVKRNSPEELRFQPSAMRVVYEDGQLLVEEDFQTVRDRLATYL